MSLKTTGWPPEKRARVAAKTRADKPWLHATGPRTDAGKQAVKDNALKHGYRSADYTALLELLREQEAMRASLHESAMAVLQGKKP
jgi:hypothetical protein